jgi:hypothetical protein
MTGADTGANGVAGTIRAGAPPRDGRGYGCGGCTPPTQELSAAISASDPIIRKT